MEEHEYYCPEGCGHDHGRAGQPEAVKTARKIEDTEPDASGAYKTAVVCDECNILFYIVREPY